MNYGYLLIVCAATTVIHAEDACKTLNSCSCEHKNGSVVDISQNGFSNGMARFQLQNVSETNNLTSLFSFNPCFPFTDTSKNYSNLEPACTNVAACWYENVTLDGELKVGLKTAFGQQDTAQFTMTGGELAIKYFIRGFIKNHDMTVHLKCSKDSIVPQVKFNDLNDSGLFLTLTSKCACPGECSGTGTGGDNSGLSVGSILIIIFFTFLLVYFFGGIVFNVVIRGAAGKEVIPNYTFWSNLPGLIMDGINFVCCCFCSAKSTNSPRTYDDIS